MSGAWYKIYSELGWDEEEVFAVGTISSYQGILTHTNDFNVTYTLTPIDSQFVFGQIWGRFPDVYRGGLPGEVYVSSMFPYNNQYNPDVKYKVSFSADTGHTFRHVYESKFLDPNGPFPIFMSDREPGVFYIVKSYQVEDFNPWGHHTKVCIEYYRDYGETLVGIYCHDLHKNYGKTCEAVNDLVSEKCGNSCVLLSWSEPESSLPVIEYQIYRNEEFLTSITTTSFLDDNLEVGEYAYYVIAHYEMGCVADSSNHVTENITVGVKEINDLEGVKVYPNPAFSAVTIETNDFSKVEIYNIFGQLLQTAKTRVVDVSTFNAGVYFFKIFDTAWNNVSKRVVVVR